MTTDASKYTGTFQGNGFVYEIPKIDSFDVVKRPLNSQFVVSVYDETPYGTILERKAYNSSGKLTSIQLGLLKVIRNCCGKIISKCLEFVDDDDNGVVQWYVVKRDKKGNVLEYSSYRVEAGYSAVNPKQFPTVNVASVVRV